MSASQAPAAILSREIRCLPLEREDAGASLVEGPLDEIRQRRLLKVLCQGFGGGEQPDNRLSLIFGHLAGPTNAYPVPIGEFPGQIEFLLSETLAATFWWQSSSPCRLAVAIRTRESARPAYINAAMTCSVCDNKGWVCENHPDRPSKITSESGRCLRLRRRHAVPRL